MRSAAVWAEGAGRVKWNTTTRKQCRPHDSAAIAPSPDNPCKPKILTSESNLAAKDDLELERHGENQAGRSKNDGAEVTGLRQVFVKKILGPGPALQKNVLVGDVVSKATASAHGWAWNCSCATCIKVNKQKIEWRSYLSEEENEHIELLGRSIITTYLAN